MPAGQEHVSECTRLTCCQVGAECGRREQRSRLLPARVVVYFVLAMCLFSGQGY
ncbi:transposase domain-containing protein, partial [Streptomyces sp. NPDC047985]